MTDPSPEDGARFRQAMRGYDKVEVDGAIKSLRKQLADLAAERDQLKAAVAEASGVPADYDQFAGELANVLKAAEDAAAALTKRTEVEAEQRRAAAAAEAEALVAQAHAEAEVSVANAEEDVRIVRAEAEREAHRLVAAAKKEAEDLVRVARMEAERLHTDATTESDRLLGDARQAAEAAQARAHALEVRRDELLAELESVRSTVSRLEGEIDERRVQLEAAPVPEPAVEEIEQTGRDDAYDGVRVIPAPPDAEEPDAGPVGEPVETMDVVEEVRRLKEEPEAEPEPEPETAPVPEPEATDDGVAGAEVVEEAVVEAPDDGLGDLFASLRGGAEEVPVEPDPVETESVPDEPSDEPAPEPSQRTDRGEVEAAVEHRDRRILPITNGALRGVKRELADAQNEALEGIRTEAQAWRPSRPELVEHLEPTLLLVRDAARRAGAEWAAGLLRVDHSVGGPPDLSDSVMAGDLAASIERALDRGSDAAAKGAEVSRVFRSWRSDTAERHLRSEAMAAYHQGIREVADAADVAVALHQTRPCSTCAEVLEAGKAPLPPIHEGCTCILLPA